MRLDELQINEEQVARKFLKEKYPHLTEEQIDEVLPALLAPIGAGLATAGRVGLQLGTKAAQLGVQGAKVVGKGIVKGGQALAKATKAGLEKGATAVAQVGKNTAKAMQGGTQAPSGQIGGATEVDPAVKQQQKKTVMAQMKANDKQHKTVKSQLMKQLSQLR